MAFNTAIGRAEYTSSAGQTVFPFVFKIFNETDLNVYQTLENATPDDTTDILILGTDYTVSIDGDAGGEITLLSSASVNDTLTLVRDLPITRETEYQTSGDLLAETLNDDQEYQTYLILDSVAIGNRALTLPETDVTMSSLLPPTVESGYLRAKTDLSGFEYTTNLFSVDEGLYVDSIATMLALDVNVTTRVTVLGYYAAGDKGGGVFSYDPALSATNNHGTIIGGWVRSYNGEITPEMFGAYGNGTTDDYQAIVYAQAVSESFLMKDASYRIASNITFTVSPIFSNASLVIDSGKTVTFQDKPNAEREELFTGDGVVSLEIDKALTVFPEWYGAFPDLPALDTSPLLQAMFDSFDKTEALVLFNIGTYYMSSAVTIPRATNLQGKGDRLTHFRASFTTGDVFTTLDEGVHFNDIQFSCSSTRTSGAYIQMSHNYCKAQNIWFTDGHQGIDMDASVCVADNVQGFNWSTAAGSSIVNAADDARISNIRFIGSTAAPEYVVKIDNVANVTVLNFYGSGANTEGVVGVLSSTSTSSRHTITNILADGTKRALYLLTSSTGEITNIATDTVIAKNCTVNGIHLSKQGSGIFKHITMENIHTKDCQAGIVTESASGQIAHVTLSTALIVTSAAIGIDLGEIQYITISGCQTITSGTYGIQVQLGSDNFILTSNQSLFSVTAELNDLSGAVTKVIQNNIGF